MEGHYTTRRWPKERLIHSGGTLYEVLAAAEKYHAGLWAERILELGGQVLKYTRSESVPGLKDE